jgi:hypothetical protein
MGSGWMIMKKTKKSKNKYTQKKRVWSAGTDEKGSVMVIVLMVLVLVTLGGIAAINSSVTESFIVRNSAIHKQNLQLAEIAALEGFREILTRNDATQLLPGEVSAPVWIRDMSLWNNDPAVSDESDVNNFPLTDNNSGVTQINTLVQRGEGNDDLLRYYFIGWRDAPQSSLVMTGSMWRQGRVIGIYNSDIYGLASVEVGVVKRF